jgi:1-acyl-sn-glycerol-3-phosphate acyltransferase
MILYDIAKFLIRIVGAVLWRARAAGEEHVPMTGPLVVACNHISNLDPPLLGAYCPRRIRYMAKKELFAIPVLGPLIAAVGAYPVDREGSATAAIKRSVEVLREGGCVGIFPEGGRNVHGDKEARTGVALIASLAKAPVLPAYIHNSARAGQLATITVAFGQPMRLPAGRKATREDLAKFTDDVMDAIRALGKSIDGNS